MAVPKLRLTKSIDEMHNLLDRLPQASTLTLWFNTSTERVIFDGSFLKLDKESKRVYVQLKTAVPGLEKQGMCYLKFFENYGGAKTFIINHKDNLLVLELPDEMVMAEMRNNARQFFQPKDGKTVTFKVGAIEKTFSVVNASLRGLAIATKDEDQDFFKSAPKIEVVKLNEHPMTNLYGDIVAHRTGTTAGVSLEAEIPKDVFDQFVFVKRPVEIPPEKLFKDLQYRETVKKNMFAVQQRLIKKPRLSQLFKNLEVNRADNAYLKNHIDLLCDTTCSIGKKLGWVTEGAVDKLIYVAYMHDVRYFEHPELAKIGSFENFKAKKDTLSPELQKIYLDGPAYAAMLAKEDDTISPDVEKILIQQKERPDGSGFPYAVKAQNLVPLSCLFMVCHELVDYIIENPKWTFKEFLLIYRNMYKGQYFSKIFAVLSELSN